MDLRCIWHTCNQYVKPNSDMCTMHHLKFKAKDLKRVPTMAAQSDKRKALQKSIVQYLRTRHAPHNKAQRKEFM